jgi:ATP-dependent Clp protease ATP-binding subunit ClpA
MTGHLLLGVLEEPQCAGGLILAKMQFDLNLALSTTNFVLHYGRRRDTPEEPTVEWEGIPHTRAAHAVLAYAWEEADLFDVTYPIGTEHLLLGMLRVPEGMGCRLLRYFGVELDRARAKRDEFWELLRLAE